MGPVDERLPRDLFSRKPTVITVMLGMNDGSYTPSKPEIENTYRTGYQHIIDRFKAEAPRARVFLIKPSPYDDVTREPGWPGGYNSVLRGYSDLIQTLATANGYATVDFNTPVVQMLEAAKASNPGQAAKIIGDRVHPGPAGHLVMAEQLLLAWGATPVVSHVTIDSASGQAQAMMAKVQVQTAKDTIRWTQTEGGLPFPLDRKDANTALVLSSSDFDEKLNKETLIVKNLKTGTYRLSIDGKPIGDFTADQLATGINLAQYETPMMEQARAVAAAVNRRADLAFANWRQVEFAQRWAPGTKRDAAVKALEAFSDDLIARARTLAKPAPHSFELAPVSPR
jgi:hypothetical protein